MGSYLVHGPAEPHGSVSYPWWYSLIAGSDFSNWDVWGTGCLRASHDRRWRFSGAGRDRCSLNGRILEYPLSVAFFRWKTLWKERCRLGEVSIGRGFLVTVTDQGVTWACTGGDAGLGVADSLMFFLNMIVKTNITKKSVSSF